MRKIIAILAAITLSGCANLSTAVHRMQHGPSFAEANPTVGGTRGFTSTTVNTQSGTYTLRGSPSTGYTLYNVHGRGK